MRQAIYAGSFDPWSHGHQFVLNAALDLFDRIHVLAAVNPAKAGDFDPLTRTRAIAHSVDPLQNWWDSQPQFAINEKIVVSSTSGLVVDYAREHNIGHLIRGLRSTTDFESEFGLYFSNRAIHPSIQTWCLMCPPELIHCSSTFVRSVIGRPSVNFVGTSFINQAILLKTSRTAAHVLDVIQALSEHRFDHHPADLTPRVITEALQKVFHTLNTSTLGLGHFHQELEPAFQGFLQTHRQRLRAELNQGKYPENDIYEIWKLIFNSLTAQEQTSEKGPHEEWMAQLAQLGKTEIPLFDGQRLRDLLLGAP
jgi:pantetheine-phosphate adenylyltransferase